MMLMEFGQATWGHALQTPVALVLAPAPGEINTEGILSFFASKVAPILLGVLGVIFIGRASKGEVSKVLTSSAIAIIGIGFIAGAAGLFVLLVPLFMLIHYLFTFRVDLFPAWEIALAMVSTSYIFRHVDPDRPARMVIRTALTDWRGTREQAESRRL